MRGEGAICGAAPAGDLHGVTFGSVGSADDSRLADKRDRGTLKARETVTLDDRADVRLRTDWSTPDNYVLGQQIGLMPASATDTVGGETPAFRKGQV